MQKAHVNTDWEDYPSTKTPVDEYNLNKLERSVDVIDDRVITLDTTKATKVEVSELFKGVAYDDKTGIITFTRKNGATVTIDTPMEKITTGIYYNPTSEKLVLPLIDGTSMEVDLSRLMKFDEFIDSDTIAFSVNPNGTVAAIVKEGSIEEKHLQPNYLADIRVETAKAESSRASAEESEKEAKKSEMSAKESENAAAGYASDSSSSSATAVQKASEAIAGAEIATQKAREAGNSASEAAESAENASVSEGNASASASSSANSAAMAGEKASEASVHAGLSKSYAVGTDGQVRENDNFDCAEHYYEQAKRVAQGISGIVPMGTITFEGLGNAENQKTGYMFNVSDSFVSDDRFLDGGGIFYGAGNNVLYTADNKWDVLAGVMVSGVKGDAESEYRQGFVSLTPENIGALPKDGNAATATRATQDGDGSVISESYLKKTGNASETTVSFSSGDSLSPSWTDVSLVSTGETTKSLWNKASTFFKNIRWIKNFLGTTNISSIGGGTVTGAVSALNTGLAGKANTNHNHDSRYPTIEGVNENLNKNFVTTFTNSNFSKISGFAKYVGSYAANATADGINYLIALNTSSDKRIKKNIKDTDTEALDLINAISHKSFDFKYDEFGAHSDIGYIAQELMEIIPEAVTAVPQDEGKFGYGELYQINYQALIPYLTKAVQELSGRLDSLEE